MYVCLETCVTHHSEWLFFLSTHLYGLKVKQTFWFVFWATLMILRAYSGLCTQVTLGQVWSARDQTQGMCCTISPAIKHTFKQIF